MPVLERPAGGAAGGHGTEFDEVWGLLPGQEDREVVVKRSKREGAAGR